MTEYTYLAWELGWALPVILGQWVVGRRRLAARWRTCLMAIAAATCWLCVADAIAISQGVWALSPALTTGVWLGPLPLEEAVFFLLTNTMLIQGLAMTTPAPRDAPGQIAPPRLDATQP